MDTTKVAARRAPWPWLILGLALGCSGASHSGPPGTSSLPGAPSGQVEIYATANNGDFIKFNFQLGFGEPRGQVSWMDVTTGESESGLSYDASGSTIDEVSGSTTIKEFYFDGSLLVAQFATLGLRPTPTQAVGVPARLLTSGLPAGPENYLDFDLTRGCSLGAETQPTDGGGPTLTDFNLAVGTAGQVASDALTTVPILAGSIRPDVEYPLALDLKDTQQHPYLAYADGLNDMIWKTPTGSLLLAPQADTPSVPTGVVGSMTCFWSEITGATLDAQHQVVPGGFAQGTGALTLKGGTVTVVDLNQDLLFPASPLIPVQAGSLVPLALPGAFQAVDLADPNNPKEFFVIPYPTCWAFIELIQHPRTAQKAIPFDLVTGIAPLKTLAAPD